MKGYQFDSIKNLVGKMETGKLVLPSIQREYVWSEGQIISLFDSIMRGYPIGTFLFWDVERNKIKNYGFRKFNNYYDEYLVNTGTNIERPAKGSGITEKTITGVLDGQQRLTSLLIGFNGYIRVKTKNGWGTNSKNYSEKELYIDINCNPEIEKEDDEIAYNFSFIEEKNVGLEDTKEWVKVKDIVEWDKTELKDKSAVLSAKCNNKKNAKAILTRIWNVYNAEGKKSPIHYYVTEDDEIKDVLNIFERANKGGTPLSRTHLLFSIVISNWKNARKEFSKLEGEIRQLEFSVDTDFLMKTSLFLMGLPVNLKTNTFTKESITKVQNNWENISSAIIETFNYVNSFGYRDKNIISYNAIIPLIYFFYYNKNDPSPKARKEMQKYLLLAQTKGVFRSGTNSVLNNIRYSLEAANVKGKQFSMRYFKSYSYGDRNFEVNEEYIDSLLDYNKGKRAFAVLSVLYTNEIDFDHQYQMDHMHPESAFNVKNLKSLGLDKKTVERWMEECCKLPNLQLLKGQTHSSQKNTNQQKSNMPLVSWLKNHDDIFLPKDNNGEKYDDSYYELLNFQQFFDDRREKMKEELLEFLTK